MTDTMWSSGPMTMTWAAAEPVSKDVEGGDQGGAGMRRRGRHHVVSCRRRRGNHGAVVPHVVLCEHAAARLHLLRGNNSTFTFVRVFSAPWPFIIFIIIIIIIM
ncbi:hypothetical protein EYF80_059528 [Liparis tanakae]|uniref:Uncharacterized protein n=1 Tax=Liparis tanakae TaxID=230148 RepID=A0A4Z2ENJ6_9TELE|nr:hypothetical protein EYF80_059528 [Liparis tanakae]